MNGRILIFSAGLLTGTLLGSLIGTYGMMRYTQNRILKSFNTCEIFQKIGTDNLVEIVECFNENMK